MAKQVTFSVSKTGKEPIEVTFLAPESLTDPRWKEVVSNPDEDINELALQNLVIKIQSGARQRLDQGKAAVQAYVDAYKYGARQAGLGSRPVVISTEQVKRVRFSPEQIAALKAAGVVFEESE